MDGQHEEEQEVARGCVGLNVPWPGETVDYLHYRHWNFKTLIILNDPVYCLPYRNWVVDINFVLLVLMIF